MAGLRRVTVVWVLSGCNWDGAFISATEPPQPSTSAGATSDGDAGAATDDAGAATDDTGATPTSGIAPTTAGPGDTTSGTSTTGTTGPTGDPSVEPFIDLYSPNVQGDVSTPQQVVLAAEVSANVTDVELYQNGVYVTTVIPPVNYLWEISSDAQDGPYNWEAIALTAADGSAMDTLPIEVDLPPGGQPTWNSQLAPDGNLSVARGVVVVGEVAHVVGYRSSGTGSLVLRSYVGEDIVAERTPADFSQRPEMIAGPSIGVDIAADADGSLIVAGNYIDGEIVRRYVARIAPDGTLDWDKLGNVGETANGVAVGPDGRVYLAGSTKAPNDTTTLTLWSWDVHGLKPWMGIYEDKNDLQNTYSEWANAVAVTSDRVVVVGVREILDDFNAPIARSLVLVYSFGGGEFEELRWTSPGDFGEDDAALDVVALGDEYCMTGWSGEPPRAVTRCSDGLWPWWSVVADDVGTTGHSITRNPLGEAVIAGERWKDALQQQAWITALVPGTEQTHWTIEFGGPKLDRVYGVDCADWGPCGYAGVTQLNAWQWVAGGFTP